jgi:hypothetical protein
VSALISLSPPRAGPYVRALSGALHALGPHEGFPPLADARAHLAAMDPSLSGEIVGPAEVVASSGMPAYGWMQRVNAEARVAASSVARSEAELLRASRLDPALGSRLRDRESLHQHLRSSTILASSRAEAALVKGGSTIDVRLTYDRIAPDGCWVRMRAVVRMRQGGGAPVVLEHHTAELADDRITHLLARHLATPLPLLNAALERQTGSSVVSLERNSIGPFWFPGASLPAGLPADLASGLLLHATSEELGGDVRGVHQRDPLARGVLPPSGIRLYRERRFAADRLAEPALRRWLALVGVDCPIHPIGLRPRRSL